MKKALLALLVFTAAGAWAFPGLTNEEGSHYEITQTALENLYRTPFGEIIRIRTVPLFGIEKYEYTDPRLGDIVCYASGGPDLYYFGQLPPHSQTQDYDYSVDYSPEELLALEREALDDYFLYCSSILAMLFDCLRAGELREGAYLLGFYLHTYEDLFSHQGITNSQHIYYNDQGRNPDYNADHLLLARAAVERFLSGLPDYVEDPVVRERLLEILTSDEVIAVMSPQEVKALLGRGMDIYWEGIKYQFFTSGKGESARYVDQIRWDYQAILDIVNSREGMRMLLAYKERPDLDAILGFCGYEF